MPFKASISKEIILGFKLDSCMFHQGTLVLDEPISEKHLDKVELVGTTPEKKIKYTTQDCTSSDRKLFPNNEFLCFTNKKTGEKVLMKIKSKQFQLVPSEQSIQRTNVKLSEETEFQRKLKMLGKKDAKTQKSFRNNRISESVRVQKMEEAIAAQKKINEEASEKPAVEQKNPTVNTTYILPLDEKAVQSSDVYNINDVIRENEFAELLGVATEFLAEYQTNIAQWKKEKKYSLMVLNSVELLSEANVERRMHIVQLLLYYDYLIKFLKAKSFLKKDKDNNPEIPLNVYRKLQNKYTEECLGGNKRPFSQTCKIKVKLHAIVLQLFVHNYSIVTENLLTDLNVKQPELTKLASVLRCHTRTKEKRKMIELSIPLYDPPLPGAGRKRRRDE